MSEYLFSTIGFRKLEIKGKIVSRLWYDFYVLLFAQVRDKSC